MTAGKPHWHILGAGAMGGLFGAGLKAAGCRVTLLLREDSPTPVTALTVEDATGRRYHEVESSAPSDCDPIELLLVATKAYDVVPAVESVLHRLVPRTVMLLLANGMGFETALRTRFPHLDIYSGTTTEGAFRLSPGKIRHAGRGSTRLGQPGRATPPNWFTGFARAIPDTRWEPEIEQALWLKLAINCAINPLTAIHRCPNGQLLEDTTLSGKVGEICGEIAQVSAAAGKELPREGLRATVDSVLRGTADNRSSMLQDVLAGRRTEIDFITGYLLQTARRHQVATPCNDALYNEITTLTAQG